MQHCGNVSVSTGLLLEKVKLSPKQSKKCYYVKKIFGIWQTIFCKMQSCFPRELIEDNNNYGIQEKANGIPKI